MNGVGERQAVRCTHQQVNVVGHDDVSINAHCEATAHALEAIKEEIASRGIGEVRSAVVAAESDEMRLAGMVKSGQVGGHGGKTTSFRKSALAGFTRNPSARSRQGSGPSSPR